MGALDEATTLRFRASCHRSKHQVLGDSIDCFVRLAEAGQLHRSDNALEFLLCSDMDCTYDELSGDQLVIYCVRVVLPIMILILARLVLLTTSSVCHISHAYISSLWYFCLFGCRNSLVWKPVRGVYTVTSPSLDPNTATAKAFSE